MDKSKLIDSKIIDKNKGGSDQQQSWDSFWRRSALQLFLDKARNLESNFYLNRILKPYLDNQTVFCELGCGTATQLRLVAPFCKQVVAVDYSQDSLQKSKTVLDNVGIEKYELIEQDIRDTSHIKPIHDVVFSNGLIEHFKEPHVAIRSHLNYLKSGGTAIILAPYKYSLKNLWFKLTDNKILKKLWLWTEQYFFTKDSMEIEMNKVGMNQVDWYSISTLHQAENVLLIIRKR